MKPCFKVKRIVLTKVEYDKLKKKIFEKQGWKCFKCGIIKPLQLHHLVKRSHGRDDSEENLVGACAECHRKEDEYYERVKVGVKCGRWRL